VQKTGSPDGRGLPDGMTVGAGETIIEGGTIGEFVGKSSFGLWAARK